MSKPSDPPSPGQNTPVRAPSALGRRTLDLFGFVAALPLLCLVTLVMSIITRVVSPGPVIFRQKRIGHHGREFMLLKFRTMHVGTDTRIHQDHFRELVNSNAPMVKLDARRENLLLPGGRLLRASGLDELPQLINVLRGEMSLVGPRPCLPSEFAHYLPEQRERVTAMPGLTGLWQVSGKNRTTFEEMIRLDIEYARKACLLLDLKIILLTPLVLVGQIAGLRSPGRSPAQTSNNQAPVFAPVKASPSTLISHGNRLQPPAA